MKLHRIHQTQVLPIGGETAWDFFSDPGNLADITPDWMRFRITSEVPDQMYAGLIITYRLGILPGFSIRWVTEITHLDPGRMFVDEQRSGPYRFWHHQHVLRGVAEGTLVEDIVHYALPLGWLGTLAHRLFVRRRLHEIFRFRARVLDERFPDGRCSLPSGENTG